MASPKDFHLKVPNVWLPIEKLRGVGDGDLLAGKSVAGNVRDTV